MASTPSAVVRHDFIDAHAIDPGSLELVLARFIELAAHYLLLEPAGKWQTILMASESHSGGRQLDPGTGSFRGHSRPTDTMILSQSGAGWRSTAFGSSRCLRHPSDSGAAVQAPPFRRRRRPPPAPTAQGPRTAPAIRRRAALRSRRSPPPAAPCCALRLRLVPIWYRPARSPMHPRPGEEELERILAGLLSRGERI